MSEVHRLSRRDARRIAVTAQLLAAERPIELVEMVAHLTSVQADPTAAVAPSAELVAWCRLGEAYRLGELDAAFAAGRLIELGGMLRPAGDIALHRAEMASHSPESEGDRWLAANDGCRREILDLLADEGPRTARDLPDTCAVPWQSSGWNNDRNVRMMIALLERRGVVAVAGREGRDRLWDLAERVYPDGPTVPREEAATERARRWLRSVGLWRGLGPASPITLTSMRLDEIGEPAEIEGVRGRWRVDPTYLDRPFRGRAVLLSPLDRLVMDRKRTTELFDFDYQLEMYKPAAKRRWGYWAMPILYGDRLVGKLDAASDRERGVLRVHAVHEEGDWSRTQREAVRREIHALADWLDLVPEFAAPSD